MIEPPAVVTADDWNRCRPWIEGALRYAEGTHDIWDVLAEVEANRATFWPFERSALVTQMIDYPKKRVFLFWLGGGSMANLLSKEADLVDYGRRNGADRVSISGRLGWIRAMRRFGYRPAWHVTYKDI